uniref:Uncharacterized protein n=1 Tax=Anopheles quadriannulatus TaxID=34691 RepID=A0A182XQK7_ANOQN
HGRTRQYGVSPLCVKCVPPSSSSVVIRGRVPPKPILTHKQCKHGVRSIFP